METFHDYAYYYNSFYKDKDYKGEAQIIKNFLDNHIGGGIYTILDLGCGTGTHDIELAKHAGNDKVNITGIDISPQMIEIARQRGKKGNCHIDFEVADIRDYTAKQKYDAVVSLFHVMSYQNSNSDFLKALSTAKLALKKDGIFIFDIWYGPGVLSDKPAVRVKQVEDEEYILYRIARPEMYVEENIVDVNYEVLIIEKSTGTTRKIEEIHKLRYFFVPEIKYYLEQSGFELIDCLDCNTLGKTDFNSWTAYCIAKNLS